MVEPVLAHATRPHPVHGPELPTKMACATGMDLEQRYLQMITATRSYTVSDSALALRGDSAVHARFVAR